MAATFKVIKRPPRPNIAIRIIRESVRAELRPIANLHVSRRNAVVSSFKHTPKFDSKITIGARGIELAILLVNAGQSIGKATIGDLVKWLFVTGTKAHIIAAKGGKLLAFQWGGKGSYERKVSIGGAKGSGQVSNPTMFFRRVVRHPGFRPSKALENINKQLGLKMNKAIERGYIIGHNRAKK